MTTMTTLQLDPWTVRDRDAVPDDGLRREVLDGVLIVSPAPRPVHQQVLLGLYRQLFAACPGHLQVLVAPVDVRLDERTVLEPDLLVARRDAFDERGLPGRPDLAVEVLSPSSRGVDALLKRDRFERAGTPSFWLVDPEAPSLVARELRDGRYEVVAEVGPGDAWAAQLPFAVELTPGSWAR